MNTRTKIKVRRVIKNKNPKKFEIIEAEFQTVKPYDVPGAFWVTKWIAGGMIRSWGASFNVGFAFFAVVSLPLSHP